jgi:hypothetical protein
MAQHVLTHVGEDHLSAVDASAVLAQGLVGEVILNLLMKSVPNTSIILANRASIATSLILYDLHYNRPPKILVLFESVSARRQATLSRTPAQPA